MEAFILKRNDFICGICVSPDAPDTAVTAAGELIRCLGVMCSMVPGMHMGIPKAGEICLGGKSADCETDELRIRAADGILWIDGGKRGILYGVYELLEQLGCRFFAQDCEILPEAEELTVPADLDICQKPVFEYRCTNWNGITWRNAPKLRLNAVLNDTIPESWGGDLHYQGFVHTLGELAEMERVDGEFTDRQPCLSEEKTFQTVVKNLRSRLEEDPGAAIASVSQNDSHDWGRGCTCPACSALDEAEGTPMGSLLTFVNRVAKEMEADYPDLAVDTLAYRYTRKPPMHLCSRENVIIRLCSIECCFSHAIEECSHAIYNVEDGSFADTLRQWGLHSKRIYIWDYTTNFRSYHNCFPNFGVLRKNVRFFAENNVRGVFEQGDQETVNGEFGPLRTYLLSKLLWDPYMSEETYQRHINEFLTGYYGSGASHIRSFLDRLLAAAKDVHFGIYFEDPTELFLDPETEGSREERAAAFLKKGREDFDAARKEADPVQRQRISRSEIQLDLYEWFLLHNRLAALAEEDPAREAAENAVRNAGAKLHAHVVSCGITHMYEGGKQFLTKQPDYLELPCYW